MAKLFKLIKLAISLIARNIRWLWIKLVTWNGEIIREVNGSKMILLTSRPGLDLKERSIHKQLALDGVREREATKIIQSILKPGDAILEIGANIGYYALMESRIVGSTGRIYAIEPESNNFKLLKRNLELNRTDNVETFHQAISDRDGTSKLYLSDSSNLHSMVPTANTSASATETVSVQTVDSFLAGKRPVQLLRMDIEGYEYEALKGMTETLKRPNLKMFIELHSNILPSEKSLWILNELKSHGFSITASISHDKFIQRALGRVRVTAPTIDHLIQDPDLTSGRMGFLLFFEKHG